MPEDEDKGQCYVRAGVSDFTLGRIDSEARRPFVDRNQFEEPPLTAEEWATVLQGIYLGTVLDELAHMEEVRSQYKLRRIAEMRFSQTWPRPER